MSPFPPSGGAAAAGSGSGIFLGNDGSGAIVARFAPGYSEGPLKLPFYPRVEKALKLGCLIPLTLWRYGSLRPARAQLYQCPHWIYIDPHDPCALKKVVQEPLRGKVSTNLIFWREMLQHLQPDLAVDVGLNYGECLFGASYPARTRMFGFEANPRLIPYLEQSRAEHPQGRQMTITNCLVSDVAAEAVPFLVNPKWSGQSSAVREINAGAEPLEFQLRARRLTDLLPAVIPESGSLLFKMDIEGFEHRALRGFEPTLRQVGQCVGLIEFTSRFIRWAGSDPADYFAWLCERFLVYRFVDVKRRQVTAVPTYASLPFKHNDPECADADLILIGRQRPGGWLPPGWTLVTG